ncbi:MAG: 3-dehydroquinate synthase family protein, partial [Acidobacteriota bacterium]|nr:3-dehydroquinate synthase family protein [Acidobacteriota bacterium]
LPQPELRAGLAEVVKSAAIADSKFLSWLERSTDLLLERNSGALEHAIGRCLAIKGKVVSRDERETGRRAVLNFGHTLAHAIETASAYSIRHGHAVAIGMVIEADLAAATAGFPTRHARRIERLLEAFGLPVAWPEGIDPDRVVEATRRDKKARAGRARYALPERIGRMRSGDEVTVELDEEILVRVITERSK